MAMKLFSSMKHYNWHRTHGLYTITGAVFTAALLASCAAEAEDQEPIQLPKTVALDDCLSLTEQALLTACFDQLDAQDAAEIAAQKARIARKKHENAAKRTQIKENDRVIAEQEAEMAQLDTTIVVLTKEADAAMRRLEERILEPQE